MWNTRRLIGCVAALATLLWTTAVWAQGLADRVPADALLYVEWAGGQQLQPAYAQSHLKAVIDHTTWPAFLEDGLPRLITRLPDTNRQAKEALRQVYNAAALMAAHPTALYVAPVAPPQNGPPQFRVMLLCDAGDDAGAIAESLNRLVALGGQIPFPLHVRIEGRVVVLDAGTAAAATTQPAPAKPLSADPVFTTTLAQVQKDAALRVFINVPGLLDNAERAAASGPPEAQNNLQQAIDAFGLRGLGPVALSCGFDGQDWMQQAFVSKGEKNLPPILLHLLGGTPLSADALAKVPADALVAVAGRIDFAALYDDVLQAAKDLPHAEADRIDQTIANLNKTLGFNLRDDLLAASGEEYAVYASPTVGGTGLSGFVLTSTPRDVAKLQSSLQRMEGTATGLLSMQARRGQPNFSPQVVKFGAVSVHYVALLMAAPSWTFVDGTMYAGLAPQTVAAAAQAKGGGLAATPAYQQTMRRLGVAHPTRVVFVDLPRTAPESYGVLIQLGTLANTFGRDLAPLSLVPPLPAILPELSPMGGAAWMDDAGWHSKVLLPLPGAQLLTGGGGGMMMAGPAMIGLTTAVLLPSLGKARELANRAADAAALTGVARSGIIWAQDHNDKLPDNLAQLVLARQVPIQSLISKSSSRAHAPIPHLQPGTNDAAVEAWILANSDIVWAGGGQMATTDSARILAYTKLAAHRDGAEVAFGDAHVEWVAAPALAALFDTENAWRTKQGLPALMVDGLAEKPQ